ncbi:MAG: hypothetical protein HZA89_17270 [Verrucomicrobia bacterium]|nr:hypothetical protein [Verrucomicrobiota bacterium]
MAEPFKLTRIPSLKSVKDLHKRCAAFLLLFSFLTSGVNGEGVAAVVMVSTAPTNDRQVIEGFGGALAFWGYDADDATLRYAFEDLGATIVRVPGDVDASGNAEKYRAVLARVSRVAPQAKVLVSFWQPRSAVRPQQASWLETNSSGGYVLKREQQDAWADEIASRLKLMRRDWGANVAAVSVQNEPNFSVPGSPTCFWTPEDLAGFVTDRVAPRLQRARLSVELSAPDLAYTGHDASEAKRFHAVSAAPATAIFAYHMYDSFRTGDTNGGWEVLRARQQALGAYLRAQLPAKRVWMTETTGAQWNSRDWHTYGWSPGMDEHDKAIAAARYLHTALVDAGANAFLWWGLAYSAPPASVQGEEKRQKFRDEGLILVGPEQRNGMHPFQERTKKYFALKHYFRFVRPGDVRLEADAPEATLLAAFRSTDRRRIVLVLTNPGPKPSAIEPRVIGDLHYRLQETWVTDRAHECARVEWRNSLSPESVTTLVYAAE